MGSGYNGMDAVLNRPACHGEALFQGLGAIVHTGENVTVQINQFIKSLRDFI